MSSRDIDRSRRFRSFAAAAAGLLCAVAPLAAIAAPGQLYFRHLSANLVNDGPPRIAGGNVVWQSGTGATSEIYLSLGGAFGARLTSDARADELPDIDGNQIVWQHDDGADLEILSYDIVTEIVTELTGNADEDTGPLVSGGNVAFMRNEEIYLLPAPGPILSAGDDYDLAISSNNVVFTKDTGTDLDVWAWFPNLEAPADPGLYELSTPGDATDEYAAVISGERVVFVRQTVTSTEIIRFDPTNYPVVPITNDGTPDDDPHIDGTHVVWTRGAGAAREIYRWTDDGVSIPLAVTANAVADHSPYVDGDDIVWVSEQPGDSEIWACRNCFTGGTPQQITNNTESDRNPLIEAGIIVYQSCDNAGTPQEECDVLMAPEPGQTLLVATALATLGFLASRSARRAVAVARDEAARRR